MTSRCRALFKVMGGGPMGLGHVRRSLSLCQASEALGIEVSFHCNDNESCLQLLAGQRVYVGDLAAAMTQSRPEVLLWDQQQTSPDEMRPYASTPILALDYFAYGDSFPDRIINLYHHERSGLAQACAPERLLEGHEYSIIRSEFTRFRKDRRAAVKVGKILVSFGGTDPSGHSASAVKALLSVGYGECELLVVLGPEARFDERILDAWPGPSRIARAIDNMAETMAKADFACTGGGTSLLEACYLGLPCLVLSQNPREAAHAAAIAAQGAAVAVSDDAHDIGIKLASMADASYRQRLSDGGQALIDGRGAERILQVLRSLALVRH